MNTPSHRGLGIGVIAPLKVLFRMDREGSGRHR
jgi:hypothetical protein